MTHLHIKYLPFMLFEPGFQL